MISVKLHGRLGNQLFQYSFIYALSRKIGTPFYLDQQIDKSIIHKYFTIRQNWLSRCLDKVIGISGFKNVFSLHFRRWIFPKIQQFFKLEAVTCDWNLTPSADLLPKLQDQHLFIGFFQSPLYFIEYEAEIRSLFTIRSKYQKAFQLKYHHLYGKNKVVCIHIRRTDYLNLGILNLGGEDLSLPLNYYEKAIAKTDRKNSFYLFITDDLDFVTENFGHFQNKLISADAEIMDFQHMLNADICIISNSTFSWWSAWLNNKPDKMIYAPESFMGWRIKQEVPPDIYPDNWNLINF
ncbi:MAG: alpha-1,2-fucosyltransferase [Mucilaginibacter sp.]